MDQGKYKALVKNMLYDHSTHLIVDLKDLRETNVTRANALLNNCFDEQLAFCRALKEFVLKNHPGFAHLYDDYYVGFKDYCDNREIESFNAR